MKPLTVVSRYVSAKELAALLSVSRKTVYAWARNGLLPLPVKFGPRSRWYLPDVEKALATKPKRLDPPRRA